MGQETHDMPLRRGQIHLGQGAGNRLVKLPVENAKLVTIVLLQYVSPLLINM